MYGWRGRIGLIIPSSNTTMESEFWKVLGPTGVSVHTARITLINVTAKELKEMAEETISAAKRLATAEVDVIVFGCTSGSLLEGIEWEKSLVKKIEEATGIKAITTAGAVVQALRTLNVEKVVIATPYIDEINVREKKFLEDNGFKVLDVKGLNIARNTIIGSQPPWAAYRLAKQVYKPEAQAVFISCTNFRSLEVIDPLEKDLGVPVISSNTASLWLALRTIGYREPIKGYGVLLEKYLR